MVRLRPRAPFRPSVIMELGKKEVEYQDPLKTMFEMVQSNVPFEYVVKALDHYGLLGDPELRTLLSD